MRRPTDRRSLPHMSHYGRPLYDPVAESGIDEDTDISTDGDDLYWDQVAVAAGLLYYSNFFFVAATCRAVYRIPMHLSLAGFGGVLLAVFYIGVCRPFLVDSHLEEEDFLPRVIPSLSVAVLLSEVL
ncbi:hypothetical protein BESB_038200 [Besnoitia besnoiti]|uniref:Uncharacterized protein n=1 Tax=Besnoitia besnoiti TaxID=94643 RepID=A0A2A9MNS7_BESBE|nr:hypothetical protein BESB_038200 [Besnoitia besnoiti]PFH37362.1 hypothetical protein BESB_038200 [Besnoitia besnoiti]